jgi:hypothetical protein
MSILRLLFQCASTIKIQLSVLVLYKSDLIISLKINLCHDIAVRVSVKQQSLTH